MFHHRLVAALAVLAGLAAACDDAPSSTPADGHAADTPDPPADSDGPAPVDAAAEVADVPRVWVRLVPEEFVSGDTIVGAEVCEVTATPPRCATTTLEGAALDVPAGARATFTVTAPTYIRTLYPVPARDADSAFVFPIFIESVADFAADLVGVTRDPALGMIVVAASTRGKVGDPGAEGVAFSVDAPADGPFYVTANNTLSPTAASTGPRGAAVFFNVDAAQAVVTASAEGRACRVSGPGSPVDPETPDAAEVPLAADTVTHLQFACPEL